MSAPLARRDFFALEAGEYLERLTLLAQSGAPPDPVELVRYARALRGAALMAGPPGYAVAASAMENVAKALRDGTLQWSPSLAESLQEAIETGKELLRRLRDWAEEEIARCERTGSRLNALVGGASRGPAPDAVGTPTESAAVRSYIAREAAALAATLEQAAPSLEHSGLASLPNVSQRLQPLRGLGALPGLSPLPELLEALELTLGQAGKHAWPPGAGRALRDTAAALARIARDIASLGMTHVEAPEIVRAADSLREVFGSEDDVVSIDSLFPDHARDSMVRLGSPPPQPEAPSNLAVELMGLADRLSHAATQLRSGPPGPARALQLYSLVFALRGMTRSPALDRSAGGFIGRLDREAMTGRVLPAAERVAGVLARAAQALGTAADRGSLGSLGFELAPLTVELETQSGIEETGIVPIESLAPEPEAEIVPIESLAPSYSPFEQSFSTYYRLLHARPAAAPQPAPELEPVPIEDLLLRGRRALERADLVRRELNAALAAHAELGSIDLLLRELLDLVPLALNDPVKPA